MSPTFSITLCTFNAIEYLPQCIDSLLQQTFGDFELIIVDDGSCDGTVDYLAKLQDNRIKLILLEKNHGLIYARSTAFAAASGSFIALMDADDIAHPDRLAAQYQVLRTGTVQICGTQYQTLDTANGRLRKRRAYQNSADLRALLTIYCPLCNPSVSFDRRLLAQAGYRDAFRHAEDYAFWAELSALDCAFFIVPQHLLTYRVHPQQISRVRAAEARTAFLRAQGIYVQQLLGIHAAPQSIPWRDRLRSGMAFMQALNARLPGISVRANYEIYAEFQYRRNGLRTPLLRLERLLVALYCSRGQRAT